MIVYKEKTQSYGILDKLKMRIVIRGDFQKKEMIEDAWAPRELLRTLKHFYRMLPIIKQEYKNWISLEHLYKPMLNMQFL